MDEENEQVEEAQVDAPEAPADDAGEANDDAADPDALAGPVMEPGVMCGIDDGTKASRTPWVSLAAISTED